MDSDSAESDRRSPGSPRSPSQTVGPSLKWIFWLWLFITMYSRARIEYGGNDEPIQIQLQLPDAMIAMLLCWLLREGLTMRNLFLVVPMALISLYDFYSAELNNLPWMKEIMEVTKNVEFFLSSETVAIALTLGSSILFTIFIIKMSIDIWNGKPFERDTFWLI